MPHTSSQLISKQIYSRNFHEPPPLPGSGNKALHCGGTSIKPMSTINYHMMNVSQHKKQSKRKGEKSLVSGRSPREPSANRAEPSALFRRGLASSHFERPCLMVSVDAVS